MYLIDIGVIVLLIFFHELGHYYDARKQGIYDKVVMTGLIVGVKLHEPYKSRWSYLGGIVFSFLLYPLCLLLISVEILTPNWTIIYPEACFLFGALDLVVFFGYKKYWKNSKFSIMKRTSFNKKLIRSLGGDNGAIIWVN